MSVLAKRVKDDIVIKLPIKNIGKALEAAWATGRQDGRYRITDEKAFAEDLVNALNDEEEDGTTRVDLLFDGALYAAIDNGADGIEEHPDQEGDET